MVLQVLVDLADWEMAETLPPVTYVAQDRLTAPVRCHPMHLRRMQWLLGNRACQR